MHKTKRQQLLALARKRQQTRLPGYACIGDFDLECCHVSPYTRAACNLDAEYMVIAQDWLSEEIAKKPDNDTITLGYSRDMPTNKKLDALLKKHFGLDRSQCYLTNLFPFVKPGNASAYIRKSDLVNCAREFTLPEITIVQPRMAICLGKATFTALAKVLDQRPPKMMADCIANPIYYKKTAIHCVAHTGRLGTNNRGSDQVDADWRLLAAVL